MRVSPQTLIRGLAKLVAVVVVSAVVGVGLGYGLSELRGGGGGADTTAFTPAGATGASGAGDDATTSSTSTTPAPSGTSSPGGTAAGDDVRVTVLSAILTPATTASGRQRRRARLTVRLRAVNGGTQDVQLSNARIVSGDEEQEADPAAASDAGALLEPIGSGDRATGELRFETAGDLTTALNDSKRGTLQIQNARTADVRLTVGDAP